MLSTLEVPSDEMWMENSFSKKNDRIAPIGVNEDMDEPIYRENSHVNEGSNKEEELLIRIVTLTTNNLTCLLTL